VELCGNVTHGEEQELAISETQPSQVKKNLRKLLLLKTPQKLEQMSATVSETATPVLENINQSSADGAWVEPSAIEVLVRLYSNAVDSLLDNHITSPAQLISELLIARVMPATSRPRSAPRVTMDNSQMLSPAKKHAKKMYPTLNATLKPRNATNALKDHQTATPLPSVPPLVESHTESAIQELESAHHASKARTKIAPKLRKLVTKNASSKLSQNATPTPVNAISASQVLDASQPPLVKRHAHPTHTQVTNHTNAHGTPLNQSANKTRLEP